MAAIIQSQSRATERTANAANANPANSANEISVAAMLASSGGPGITRAKQAVASEVSR